MNKHLFIMFLVLLILSGCTKDEVVPPVVSGQDGQIVLKIDRENAPQSVATITAYLTRSGFTNITSSLNLLTDSTADLTLSDIPVGPWHLKVDAADSMGIVEYTGETDVNILENQTIQVTLTLVQVGSGVGNIYLYVTWGTTTMNWIDYAGNPIITGLNNGYEVGGVLQSRILFDNNKFKMWYMGLNPGGIGYIQYAESFDGLAWTRPINHPVIYPGNYGTWDQYSVGMGAILKEDGIYKLYYCGKGSKYSPWHIGVAVSQDGINWTKNPNPVLYAGSGWEEKIGPSDIVKKDDVYYLYYDGMIFNFPGTEMHYKIGVATSTDGIVFTKGSQNPILYQSQPWEGTEIRSGSVIYENGLFTMIYMNDINNNWSFIWGFGKATSSDGINWTKSSDNPFFTAQNTANHWTNWIGSPFYRKFNGEHWIFYSAYFPSLIYYKIGLLKGY